MKKKLITAIVLILIFAVFATVLAGCDDIFSLNEQRDATQVVASVSYKNQSSNVYKFELNSSFNSYAYYYVNYYGMSYEAAANYLVRSLAQRELLVLFAKEYISEYKYGENGKAPEACTLRELLSYSEIDRAVDNTNEQLLTSLKSIVESNITEDNYNSGDSTTTTEEDDTEVTDAVRVRFNSNGGSSVDEQKIQKGKKATEPVDPTYSGYTFYGWYTDEACTSGNEFNFDDAVEQNVTLYAKWIEYLTPRTEIPEPEEVDDYDPDDTTFDESMISAEFFDKTYLDTLYDEFKDEDFVDNIIVPSDSTLETELKNYIDDGVAELQRNLIANLYKKNIQECYDYYLDSQMKTLLITKLERIIGNSATVTEAEIAAEFNRVVAQNKETFGNSSTNYQTALSDALTSTYFHTYTDKSYGFVVNILLRLDDDKTSELTDMMSSGANKDALKFKRNEFISQMMVSISNPYYKADADVDYGMDADGNEIEIRDPMTDPNNKYNDIAADFSHTKTADTTYQKKITEGVYNDYNKLISFEQVDEEYQIVYNATEAPTMAYLLKQHPAFDTDNQIGIIHQIYNSFEQVTAAVEGGGISKLQGVYWLREVANAWLYLVGDDSGALSSDSNNNGLGYLVTPDGEDSSFLEDFTSYARTLIDNGTGAYSIGTVVDSDFKMGANNIFSGDQKAFVIADSFIESGSTSNAYAGVFVLLASYKVWDDSVVSYENADGTESTTPVSIILGEDGLLPYNYVVSYGKTNEDCMTVYDLIHDSLLTGKRTDSYNLAVNTFGLQYSQTISYNEKAYESLWKDLD